MTTTRVTHATPAALYAHIPNRDWECDTKLGKFGYGCRDIAKQLIEDAPGRDINVIYLKNSLIIKHTYEVLSNIKHTFKISSLQFD